MYNVLELLKCKSKCLTELLYTEPRKGNATPDFKIWNEIFYLRWLFFIFFIEHDRMQIFKQKIDFEINGCIGWNTKIPMYHLFMLELWTVGCNTLEVEDGWCVLSSFQRDEKIKHTDNI